MFQIELSSEPIAVVLSEDVGQLKIMFHPKILEFE